MVIAGIVGLALLGAIVPVVIRLLDATLNAVLLAPSAFWRCAGARAGSCRPTAPRPGSRPWRGSARSRGIAGGSSGRRGVACRRRARPCLARCRSGRRGGGRDRMTAFWLALVAGVGLVLLWWGFTPADDGTGGAAFVIATVKTFQPSAPAQGEPFSTADNGPEFLMSARRSAPGAAPPIHVRTYFVRRRRVVSIFPCRRYRHSRRSALLGLASRRLRQSPTENDTRWINNLLVTPAKAGVRKLAEVGQIRLHRCRASFETPPEPVLGPRKARTRGAAPQHEVCR